MTTLAEGHAALLSITAALKSNEYLGSDSRRRLIAHAEVIRRALEAAEEQATRPQTVLSPPAWAMCDCGVRYGETR